MIHVRHTSSAELARRRIRLAVRCVPCVLGPGIAVATWALSCPLPIPCGEAACDFTGVIFTPPANKLNRQSPERTLPEVPQQELPPPQVLVHAHAEMNTPDFELADIPPSSPEESPFSTDAEALLRPHPAAKKAAPHAASVAPRVQDYTPPAYLHCPHPNYPAQLRQRRIEGEVGVRIAVAADGLPVSVEITTSSGNARLDRHTCAWIKQHWKFSPARQNGKEVAAVVVTAVRFLLRA